MTAGVAALWRAVETPNSGAGPHADLLVHVLTFLDAKSLAQLLAVEKRCRTRIRSLARRYQRARGRIALGLWCHARLRVEFQARYQVLDTQRIPRSSDPRVPPRVVSIWAERGEVEGGSVTLQTVELPTVHGDGISARFVADSSLSNQRPMLTNVVQTGRRIYTTVTVKLVRSQDGGEGASDQILRRYTYLKEFGEWKTLTVPEKRLLQAASGTGGQTRFDLVSQDGSVALELDVPRGADAQTDFYLVKQMSVSLHIQELLQLHFRSIRPICALPEPAQQDSCSITLAFRTLDSKSVTRICVAGHVTLERRGQEPEEARGSMDQSSGVEGEAANSAQQPTRPRQLTAMERFEVVTCRVETNGVTLALPSAPGYAWLQVRGSNSSSRHSNLYFYAVAMHHGARQVPGHDRLRALQFSWLPGVLESFPTSDSRRRRCLKGSLRVVTGDANELQELTLVAQHLPAARLERYAAHIDSYTRLED